jgi:geranylgeranyl diphosphate synthase type I
VPGKPLDVEDLRQRVQKELSAFFDRQAPGLDAIGVEIGPVLDTCREFLEGGKRLRPAFAYWGWRGAGGEDTEEVVRAASALELLHACALIHDDVMDGSDTRRGMPSVHRRFATIHRGERWHGSPDGFGLSAAVLMGDLALIWADQLLRTSGLPDDAILRGLPVWDEMRVELISGQYLDVLEQAMGSRSVQRSLRVARYKSAKYTVERPLHLGAALAGASPSVLEVYTGYGLPLGEAFQLRDDVLGVFGDPATTGKPAGDDLREGKRTVLVATALENATPAQVATVNRLLGDSRLDLEGVRRLRAVIKETGALARTEELIRTLTAQALAALESTEVAGPARGVLRDLAVAATSREV